MKSLIFLTFILFVANRTTYAAEGIDGKTMLSQELENKIGLHFLSLTPNDDCRVTSTDGEDTIWDCGEYIHGAKIGNLGHEGAGSVGDPYSSPGFCRITQFTTARWGSLSPKNFKQGFISDIVSVSMTGIHSEPYSIIILYFGKYDYFRGEIFCVTTSTQRWSIDDVEAHLKGKIQIGRIQ